jgi:hypothetical protein
MNLIRLVQMKDDFDFSLYVLLAAMEKMSKKGPSHLVIVDRNKVNQVRE